MTKLAWSLLLILFVEAILSVRLNNIFINQKLVSIRGGAKSTKKSYGKSNFKRSSSKSGSKSSKKKKMQVIPYGYREKKTGPSWRERLETITKQGSSVYKDVYRRAKVMKSSAFEGMLLKATWPGDEPVAVEYLGEIIKYSIPAFKYSSTDGDDDPYYMTLHKLWTKMCEKDYRTTVKSLYILHCIMRDSSEDAYEKFMDAMKDMSKTRNPKKPDHRYFDVNVISELDKNGDAYEKFVHSYASYVVYRTKMLGGRFEALQQLTLESSEKKVLALLKKTQQAINLGLNCIVSNKNQANAITGFATKQVGNDLRDLIKVYGEKIAPLVEGKSYANSKAKDETISAYLEFYSEKMTEIQKFLNKASKLYNKLRIKICTELEEESPSVEAVNKRTTELLTSMSGGFTLPQPSPRSHADIIARGFDDDDEEEEDDDDDDDDTVDEDDDDDFEEEDEEDDDDDEGEDVEEEEEEDTDKEDDAEEEEDDEEADDESTESDDADDEEEEEDVEEEEDDDDDDDEEEEDDDDEEADDEEEVEEEEEEEDDDDATDEAGDDEEEDEDDDEADDDDYDDDDDEYDDDE